MSTKKNAGVVTAYGSAVAGGYQGTYEDFCALMADLGVQVGYLENMTVTVTMLDPDQNPSASYGDGTFTLNIPRGATGATGPEGPQGPAGPTGYPTDAQVQEAVGEWLGENVDPTTGYVLDRTLTQPNAAAPADLVGAQSGKIDAVSDAVISYESKNPFETTSSWKLLTSGLCKSDSSYKLCKYSVVVGKKYKIVSDHMFQFQNNSSVPASGTNSYRIGSTYESGTFILTAPEGATYLIVSTTKTGSIATVDEQIDNIAEMSDRVDSLGGVSTSLGINWESNYYFTKGVYIRPEGESSSSNWTTYYFDVSGIVEFSLVKCYSAANLTTYQISFYSSFDVSTSTFISGVQFTEENSLNTLEHIAIPENAVAAAVCNRSTSGDITLEAILAWEDVVGDGYASRSIDVIHADGSISGTVGSAISIGTQTDWDHTCVPVVAGERYKVTFRTPASSNSNAFIILTDDNDIIKRLVASNLPYSSNKMKTFYVEIKSGEAKLWVRSYGLPVRTYYCGTLIDEITRLDNGVHNRLLFEAGLKAKNRMLFSAHRGAEGQAPYGSYPCYELACQQGWDFIQIARARQSADGTWYCLHDETVDAQTNGTGAIASLTDAYIDTIYQDDGVNVDQYSTTELKLPTLESILKLAYKYGVGVSIRMGSLPEDIDGTNKDAWDSFIALCKKYRSEKMFFSGTLGQVVILKALTDNWHGQVYVTTDTVTTMISTLQSYGFTNISILASRANTTDSTIKAIHDAGYYYVSSQFENPSLSDFESLSDGGCDIAQTGMSDIHSLITE